MTTEDIIRSGKRVLELEEEALRGVRSKLGLSFAAAVEVIHGSVLSGKKVILAGTGKSGNVCQKIAATLSSTGTPALALNAQDALHGDIGIIQPRDVVLLLSYSGETEELLKLLGVISRMENQVIAMTGRANSSLGSMAVAAIEVSVAREACPLGLAPTSSSTCMLAVGDALAMALMEIRGFGEKDFARFHPAGALGARLLLRAREMMRPPERTVMIPPGVSIRQLLEETAARKSGAAIVVDDKQKLLGFFSYGDLVRELSSSRNVSDLINQTAGELMTRDPVRVSAEELAMNVLVILRDHQIDELVVVEEGDKVLGLIDSQDLVRMKLV